MSTKNVQTLIRLPADLKVRLMREAAKNNRTMSAEVAYRLRVAYGLVDGKDEGRGDV